LHGIEGDIDPPLELSPLLAIWKSQRRTGRRRRGSWSTKTAGYGSYDEEKEDAGPPLQLDVAKKDQEQRQRPLEHESGWIGFLGWRKGRYCTSAPTIAFVRPSGCRREGLRAAMEVKTAGYRV